MMRLTRWRMGCGVSPQADVTTKAVAFVFAALLASVSNVVPAMYAQTLTVLHTFVGSDGSQPFAGLTMDGAGNFYGTTSAGGTGFGTVFKLSPAGSRWSFRNLYSFRGGHDGAQPQARVVLGPDGALYGTTTVGGLGRGTVFRLRPSAASVCRSTQCPWTETVLYRFTGGSDGGFPYYGDLTFDSSGNIYGTTASGGRGCTAYGGCGVVFKLSRSRKSWKESVVYAFSGESSDGATPYSGVIFDPTGKLYGTTALGGELYSGAIYKLTPKESAWKEKTLFSFGEADQGAIPYGGLIFAQGNLYGTTFSGGGNNGSGTVFELQPSHGSWTYQVLAYVPSGPGDTPTMDNASNLYATTGVETSGTVFKLTPGGDGWTYTDLFDFSGEHYADGIIPVGGVVLDANGNIYGTTTEGGNTDPPCGEGCGVVWELTP
jgi:uncharacterized repeat protein (TIGR03803 family)